MARGGPFVSRDRELEHLLLEATVRRAGMRYEVDCRSYTAAVEKRLELGAERYGDSFLGTDTLRELREEAHDLSGWSLLALQSPEASDPTVFEALRQVMLHGALADHHARRALHARGPLR